jgi:hypothetical protein
MGEVRYWYFSVGGKVMRRKKEHMNTKEVEQKYINDIYILKPKDFCS